MRNPGPTLPNLSWKRRSSLQTVFGRQQEVFIQLAPYPEPILIHQESSLGRGAYGLDAEGGGDGKKSLHNESIFGSRKVSEGTRARRVILKI